ncbi:hypothetical protein AB0E27_03945 [Streptomyces sparsogenes]|uniref:hypothetical protein n=1 Tax=Streptomyces sparsogenes TaxID=67365 RepID=UPI0033FBD91F
MTTGDHFTLHVGEPAQVDQVDSLFDLLAGAWADGELNRCSHGNVYELGSWLGEGLAGHVRPRDKPSRKVFTERLMVRRAWSHLGIGGQLNMGLVKAGHDWTEW